MTLKENILQFRCWKFSLYLATKLSMMLPVIVSAHYSPVNSVIIQHPGVETKEKANTAHRFCLRHHLYRNFACKICLKKPKTIP